MDSKIVQKTTTLLAYLSQRRVAVYAIATGVLVLLRPDNNVTAFWGSFFGVADYVPMVSIWAAVMIVPGMLELLYRKSSTVLHTMVAMPLALFLIVTGIAIIQNPHAALTNSLNAVIGLGLILNQLTQWGTDDES